MSKEETEIGSRFERFISDEEPAISQLRTFVGGELAPLLDGSIESLGRLDEFIRNLTRDANWATASLYSSVSKDIQPWLVVRVAYYLASCLRSRFGGAWRLEGRTPVLDLGNLTISPLEIANAYVSGQVDGGLSGLAADMAKEIRS